MSGKGVYGDHGGRERGGWHMPEGQSQDLLGSHVAEPAAFPWGKC
jgi:hypothetical protein